MGPAPRAHVVVLLSGLMVLTAFDVVRADPAPSKRILLLNQAGVGGPIRGRFDAAFVEGLRSADDGPVDFYQESIESERFPGDDQSRLARDYLTKKYAGLDIDVIVAQGDRALRFARQNRELLGNPPIVTTVARAGRIDPDEGVVGLQGGFWIDGTIDLALSLFPDTRTAVVVDSTRDNNGDIETEVRRQWQARQRNLDLVYLRDLALSDAVSRLAAVPDHSIVLFVRQTIRTHSQGLDEFEGLAQALAASRAPVFSQVEDFLGRGVVGGYIWRFEADARRLAEMAIRIAGGTSPRDIPPGRNSYVMMVDWRQLQRWHIPESRLPAGTIVVFRESAIWQQYPRTAIAALLLFALQMGLIVGLLVQRARRRQAETTARSLAGRVLTAQETERARIARELHDGVCQNVATIGLEVSRLRQRGGLGVQSALSGLQTQLNDVAGELRAVSHDLHPEILQLGVVRALASHCDEVGERHGLKVTFTAGLDVEPINGDNAVCLYRLAQEAIHNACRHGQPGQITVTLERTGDAIELTIADDGSGFDLRRIRRDHHGLGLVSMDERTRLAGGTMYIETWPGLGTTVRARVPAASPAAPAGDLSGAVGRRARA
jgi:signal transduction histidine kinase